MIFIYILGKAKQLMSDTVAAVTGLKAGGKQIRERADQTGE